MTAQQHFAWLKAIDQTEGQKHWTFFNSVLEAANANLVEAETVYTELGVTNSTELSGDDQLHRRAQSSRLRAVGRHPWVVVVHAELLALPGDDEWIGPHAVSVRRRSRQVPWHFYSRELAIA